ncbi:hypothetical protein [Methanoplanus limicola]|uniref:Site-specific recombinase like protein n=1 Tax=Methanoplanus limicola DSM 2279 TaxID=937775 RepID=H1Z3A6_9EURY|nr:hypothetical protein [Methanoplanus limicola]EHQ36521.1 site-specific recombinase like protein [Methanoplanus limicola DSM 2279]
MKFPSLNNPEVNIVASEDYEDECEDIELYNENLLSEYKDYLTEKGLTPRTADKHLSNVEFFINDYLMDNEGLGASEGVSEIGMYLGYWYIRKGCWSGPAAIKENAASLKKFYQFMLGKGEISKDDFDDLKEAIKEGLPEWTATMKRYLDEDIEDMDEVWGF